MFRFIAFAWNTEDLNQYASFASNIQPRVASWRGWRNVLAVDGLNVYCAGSKQGSNDACPLANDSGVIVGTLFPKTSAPDGRATSVATLGTSESVAILETAGRHLIDHYWGRYVAFLRAPVHRTLWVLRDPAGHLPCFQTAFRSVRIYFSHAEDCARLDLVRFSMDWRYLAAHVAGAVDQSGGTGLKEVSELRAGECMTTAGSESSCSFYWSPIETARMQAPEDAMQAAALVRRSAMSCLHAWASGHDAVVLQLSGGLDSSIVLGCLKSAAKPLRVTCLTHYSTGSNTDERPFARLAAQGAACELVQRERDPDINLERMLSASRFPKPFLTFGYVEMSRVIANLARRTGATACLSGGGGDQLFYQSPSIPVVADFARRYGMSTATFKIALDVARLTRSSVWTVLRYAYTGGSSSRRWNPFQMVEHLRHLTYSAVFSDVAADAERLLHPWFDDSHDLPPGKLWHAYLLSVPLQCYDPFWEAGDAEFLDPLLSQPLIETCLRIPTYLHISNGWDRRIARLAFRNDVPAQIIRRRSKGGFEEYAKEILLRNIRFARELLLDGRLVHERLLDRKKVEEVLSGRPTRLVAGMAEIHEHLSTEAWLRTWMNQGQRAVA